MEIKWNESSFGTEYAVLYNSIILEVTQGPEGWYFQMCHNNGKFTSPMRYQTAFEAKHGACKHARIFEGTSL